MNDGTFIVILENEVNQRTLDRLVKDYSSQSAILRYPRDIINVNEVLQVASMMIECNNIQIDYPLYHYL